MYIMFIRRILALIAVFDENQPLVQICSTPKTITMPDFYIVASSIPCDWEGFMLTENNTISIHKAEKMRFGCIWRKRDFHIVNCH